MSKSTSTASDHGAKPFKTKYFKMQSNDTLDIYDHFIGNNNVIAVEGFKDLDQYFDSKFVFIDSVGIVNIIIINIIIIIMRVYL